VVEQKDSAVGYKRPPIATRFKPGKSGNPKGRKKGTHNFKADVRNELDEVITMRENERTMKITKQRALVKALVTAAIKGDMRATTALVSFCTKAFRDQEDDQSAPLLRPEDLDSYEEFVGRESKCRRGKAGKCRSPRHPVNNKQGIRK
jgi:hypothetical protein